MARRGGFPGGMPGNMTNLMKQAQRMQRQMEEKTKELEEKQYTATAGGGAVSVTVSGKKEVVAVKISPEAVDPDDVEMLEDLIVAATNDRRSRKPGRTFLLNYGLLQQSDIKIDRGAVETAGNRK